MAMNKPVAVIKVGGDMLLNQADRDGFASNLKDLTNAGWNCVVLHGGGPQLNTLQQLYGLVPTKIDGRRVTREADLLVVKQALCGEVNVDLVASLVAANVNAFG
jgi:acetylglutamate kinase